MVSGQFECVKYDFSLLKIFVIDIFLFSKNFVLTALFRAWKDWGDPRKFGFKFPVGGSVPVLFSSLVKTQFCFIHLTIQEFLAARHVTETFSPADIKKFISNNLRSHQWHLVLQFIAGLLGKKKTMSDSEYKDCIMVFAEGFKQTHDTMELNYNRVFGMKCLRERGHKGIAKDVCKTTGIKDVSALYSGHDNISPSDWEAVTFVCKHMENLSRFL